jgi:site-specific DNA recombinase
MQERAVLYARVSGDDRGKEGRNLDGQLEMGREYAQERAYKVVDELSEDDRGASGYEINLPKLNRVRDMAAAGEFDVLVVRELDRLSRNLAKQLVVEEELKRHGVRVEYVLAEYPDTPEGNLQKHVKAAIAEYEREKIKERMVRGRRLKVKAGNVLVHSTPPYGYRVATDPATEKDKLVPFEAEANIVRLIFHWYAYGDDEQETLSMGSIANKLTGMRIPTRLDTMPKRGGIKKRGYGQWSRATVGKILSREAYIGTWYYGKGNNGRAPREQWLAVEVPPLVDTETWELAQKRRKLNREMARRNTKYQYLMGRRLICGLCGTKVAGHPNVWRSKNASGLNLYYRCPAKEGAIVGVICDLPKFRVEEVDKAIWGWIESLLLNPRTLALGLREQQAERRKAARPLWERLDIIDDQIAKHQQQLNKLLDLYLGGEFPKELLTERKARLEKTLASLMQERGRLEEQLSANEITDEQITTIEEFASCVAQGLHDLAFKDKHRVISLLDVQGTLAIEKGQKVVYVRCAVGERTLGIASTPSGAHSGDG